MKDTWKLKCIFLFISLLLISCYILFHNLGSNSLWGDEAQHAIVAMNIAKTGKLYPLMHKNNIYCEKEPLKIWITALIFKLFGINEFNARVVDASFGLLLTIVIFAFGTLIADCFFAFISALILITTPPIILSHCFRNGTQDSALVFFYSLSVILYLTFIYTDNEKFLYPAGISTFLGLLVKDIFSLTIPAFTFLIEIFLFKRRNIIRKKAWLFFIIFPIVSYLLWLFYSFNATNGLHYKVLYNNLGLNSQKALLHRFRKSHLFYVKLLIKYFLISIIASIIMFSFSKNSEKQKKAFIYSLSFIILYIICISIPARKIKRYIYPIFPIASLLPSIASENSYKKVKFIAEVLILTSIIQHFVYINNKISKTKIVTSHCIYNICSKNLNCKIFVDKEAIKFMNPGDRFYILNMLSKNITNKKQESNILITLCKKTKDKNKQIIRFTKKKGKLSEMCGIIYDSSIYINTCKGSNRRHHQLQGTNKEN